MKTIIWVFVLLGVLVALFNLVFPSEFCFFTEKVIIPYTHYIVIFGFLTFLFFEYPKYLKETKLRDEQRRLYFYDLLTKDDTANRVREESFTKLLCEYKVQDFSGIKISNDKEQLNSPFQFYRCFKVQKQIKIGNDIILSSIKSEKGKIDKNIYLNKINFTNSKLSYANFCPISALREDEEAEWFIVGEHFNKYSYNFHFQYLTDVDLNYANLRSVKIVDGSLHKVTLKNASLYNSDIKNTSFIKCDLSGTDFTGANLENASFFQTKINKRTSFRAIKNYETIKYASPYIIERIKQTHYFNKSIEKWDYNWQLLDDTLDEAFAKKWELWDNLKNEFPDSFISKYKERIKKIYIENYGVDYDWIREL